MFYETLLRQDEEDPTTLARQLKEYGRKLMTISAVTSSERTQQQAASISALASPGFSFRSDVDATKFDSDIRDALCRGT